MTKSWICFMVIKKALFLDRDGIINIDKNYLYKIEDFEFIDGIFELVSLFVKNDYLIFIVTNQSGIGREYYTLEEFTVLMQWVTKAFQEKDITIEKTLFCPHIPTDNCQCRKPKTKMIDEILKKYTIDLKNSFMIGDKQSDIDLAQNSHIGTSIAIGKNNIINSGYHFLTIQECLGSILSNKISI